MTLRYDDPRVLRAGNEAFGALVRAMGWAEANGLRELPREAARLVAPARVWRRLAEAGLVHALEGGAWGLDGPARRREQLESTSAEEAPRAPLTGAERARRYRERHAQAVTPSRDERHGAVTCGVTDSVTPSRDGDAPASLSPMGKEGISQHQEGEILGAPRVSVTPPVTTVTTLPSYDDAAPAYVALVLSSWQMSTGRQLDATETWTRFLANAHARRERGQVAHATEHDFRMWVAATKPSPGPRGGRRTVQTDPPGPKAYPVASPDDEWTERRTS